jgi:prepilin-type N-terminal cleavage/methylation domain-containing protein
MKLKGFTLIELLVVISIIGVLASVVLISLNGARDKAKIAKAVADARQLTVALELYFDDMGFYPPDVNRGWDPGFGTILPSNFDTGQTDTPACPHCPIDWVNQVQAKWKGPYVARFPNTSPWDGKYDYNYWDVITDRYGCTVPAGIYFGVQGDYNNNHIIPAAAEQALIDKGYDSDKCINGESQMLLYKL